MKFKWVLFAVVMLTGVAWFISKRPSQPRPKWDNEVIERVLSPDIWEKQRARLNDWLQKYPEQLSGVRRTFLAKGIDRSMRAAGVKQVPFLQMPDTLKATVKEAFSACNVVQDARLLSNCVICLEHSNRGTGLVVVKSAKHSCAAETFDYGYDP